MSVKDNIQQDTLISIVKLDCFTHEGAIVNKKVEQGIVLDLSSKHSQYHNNALSSTDLKVKGDKAKLVGMVADRYKRQVYHVTCTVT